MKALSELEKGLQLFEADGAPNFKQILSGHFKACETNVKSVSKSIRIQSQRLREFGDSLDTEHVLHDDNALSMELGEYILLLCLSSTKCSDDNIIFFDIIIVSS